MAALEQDSSSLTDQDQGESLEQANEEQANEVQANEEQVNEEQVNEEHVNDEQDSAENQPDPVHDGVQMDDDQMNEEHMNAMIEQLCNSKADEFKLIGYEHVSGQDVWECVSDKYHKHGTPPLYQVVNDILSLKVTQFMNYITLNMYRGDQRG